MKEVDRRNFLKAVGAGVGAAALAYAPMGLLGSATRMTGGGEALLTFTAEAPLPAGARPTLASLMLRGHVAAGERVSGLVNQRIVAGYPAKAGAEVLPRMGLTGRIDRVQNGPTIELWGTFDDAADRRLLRDRDFHVTIDRGTGLVTYRLRGRSHRLQLTEFNGQ